MITPEHNTECTHLSPAAEIYNHDYYNYDYMFTPLAFIGRKQELAYLNEKYHSAAGQLIILYGRRRVGKTETLLEFCKNKNHLFYSCTETTDTHQLAAFSSRILEKGHPASRYLTSFPTWDQAFTAASELAGTEKYVLVIDEFPYMVNGNREIPSILQNLWDHTLKHTNLLIVLCGSSMSFFENTLLAEKNPLYGRATGILRMDPMPFVDAVQFFPDYTLDEKITAYAVLGGIPYYLSQFNPQQSIAENIQNVILRKGSILYSEPEFLMKQELRETAVYNTILSAIALGSTRLHEISDKTMIEKTRLTAYLKNLRELNLIKREYPVSDTPKEQTNVQRGLHILTDPYFCFWYAFVYPVISELEAGDVAGIYTHVVSPRLDAYVSRIFEDICRQYLRELNQRDLLPFHFVRIGRWWNKTDEIDIMAVDRDRRNILLGECKYRNSPMDTADFTSLQKKYPSQNPTSRWYYYLFSRSGFTPELIAAAEKNPAVTLVGPDALTRLLGICSDPTEPSEEKSAKCATY